MRAMLVVARRELLERVRSKWYKVMTVIGPLAMIALIVVPVAIAKSSTAGAKVDIVDRSGVLGDPIAAALEKRGWKATKVDPATPDATELDKVKHEKINGVITIPKDALDNGEISYRGDNASNQSVKIQLTIDVNKVVHDARIAALCPPADLKCIDTRGKIKDAYDSAVNFTATLPAGESATGAYLLAYMLAFILYFVITLYGVAVMRSVVTEKTSRVMELMVAAVKPRSLMAGKVIGVAGAALIQISIWLAVGALLLANHETVLGWFGISSAGATLPEFGALELAVVLAFFVAGFFFYASMYAAVGAMVSSEQDTNQVQMPITMLLVIGVVCLNVISNAPRGGSAMVMSNVPLWSPMLMPMRYVLGGASLGEVAISLGILVGSTLVIVRLAAKIYRVGVLMYGKRPGARELLRWLRY